MSLPKPYFENDRATLFSGDGGVAASQCICRKNGIAFRRQMARCTEGTFCQFRACGSTPCMQTPFPGFGACLKEPVHTTAPRRNAYTTTLFLYRAFLGVDFGTLFPSWKCDCQTCSHFYGEQFRFWIGACQCATPSQHGVLSSRSPYPKPLNSKLHSPLRLSFSRFESCGCLVRAFFFCRCS